MSSNNLAVVSKNSSRNATLSPVNQKTRKLFGDGLSSPKGIIENSDKTKALKGK